MIKGVGVDICSIARMRDLKPEVVGRLLTEKEKVYCNGFANAAERVAGRFAAKEAILKALGTGWSEGLGWQQIEILANAAGAPKAVLSGPALDKLNQCGATECHVSISHEKEYAVAFAVLE
jgi:holo-[acyl-carrier protein] synthase